MAHMQETAPQVGASHNVTGRCLCGAVRYSAVVKNREVGACHCSMCRRWAGGPFLVVETDGTPLFENDEHVATYRASDWGERGFCRRCGTNLFWRMQDGSHVAVSAGTLDDDGGLRFTSEIFIDEKPGYYDFANATSRLSGQQVFEMFGAQPEKG